MRPYRDEDFWGDLLDFIEVGRGISIVGEGILTVGATDEPLYPWLALRLAEPLSVALESLPPSPTVNDVVCAWLIGGGARHTTSTRRACILRDECPPSDNTLRDPASLSALRSFSDDHLRPAGPARDRTGAHRRSSAHAGLLLLSRGEGKRPARATCRPSSRRTCQYG